MEQEIHHNTGAQDRPAQAERPEGITVKFHDLPRVITLELADGSTKRYSLSFTKKSEGLILNKAF
jgi:hypothetical protein